MTPRLRLAARISAGVLVVAIVATASAWLLGLAGVTAAGNGARPDGRGVTVAVIDSGIAPDADLAQAVWAEKSRSFIDGETLSVDSSHGTEMASIIHRIAPQARLLILKALDSRGGGSRANVAEAIDYAVAAEVNVINLSLEGGSDDPELRDAIANAIAHNVLVIVAAGNDGRDLDRFASYPASYFPDQTLVVASATSAGKVASGSNYGAQTVAIAALGVDVAAMSAPSVAVSVSGTSPAAAGTTGVAAAILSSHSGYSAEDLRRSVVSAATPVAALQGVVRSAGFLDTSGDTG